MHTEHAANAAVGHVEVFLPETKVDAQAELGIEVSIELTIAVPALPPRLTLDIGTVGIIVPTRRDYSKVISVLKDISKNINDDYKNGKI